jgi:outer membrane lipoprotein SlyB
MRNDRLIHMSSLAFALALIPLLTTFISCASSKPGTATVVGSTAVGAGTGAAIGSLIGGGEGAAIGALAGAGAGALGGVTANAVNEGQTAYPTAQRDPNDPTVVISPFDNSRLSVGDRPTGSKMRDPYGRVFVIGN